MDEVNWASGLPGDVLALIAKSGGVPDMKIMREVCKTWQSGFGIAVRGIKIPPEAPVLPEGEELAQRVPGLTRLDLGESAMGEAWLQNLHAFPNLRVLVLGRATVHGAFASRLTDAGLTHLLGLSITSLDLAGCQSLSAEGLKCPGGPPSD